MIKQEQYPFNYVGNSETQSEFWRKLLFAGVIVVTIMFVNKMANSDTKLNTKSVN